MRAWSRLLTICTAGAVLFAVAPGVANAGYPFKCPKNNVAVLQHDDASATPTYFTGPGAIQAGIILADGIPGTFDSDGNPAPSNTAGDTVIVCDGTYVGNIDVPLADTGGPNDNITIRSFDDASNPTIVGNDPDDAVIDIDAPGVLLGGTHLGFEITGTSPIGIQVGTPLAPDMDQDDDQEITECEVNPMSPGFGECPDEELPQMDTSNVAVVGNEIRGLGNGTDSVTGIAVNNTSNTLLFRNKVDRLVAGADQLAVGIQYADTNYNNEVISNAVTDLTQVGGICEADLTDDDVDNPLPSSLEVPTVGAIGVAIKDEALDALVDRTLVDDIESTCTAIGVYSNAWGGLENTRNGQQVPIVTDILDNRIKHTRGPVNQAAAIALAPITPENPEDHNDAVNSPSSFRVLANDLDDHTGIAVAVLTGMAPNSWIRENDLDNGKTVGVFNASNLRVDATNNWWGCQEGPASGKCASITNAGSSTTSYTPWLKSHAAHAGSHAGEYAGH